MELLTLEQVSEELGISVSGVKHLIEREKQKKVSAGLATVRVGIRVYVEREELERYKAWKSGETSFTLREVADMTGKSLQVVQRTFNRFPQFHQNWGRKPNFGQRIIDAWVVASILDQLNWDFDDQILKRKLSVAQSLKGGDQT